MDIDKQWDEWIATDPLKDIPDITDDFVRETLTKDLTNVSYMSVEEYTLYQKWCEIHEKYPTREVSTLFGSEIQLEDHEKLTDIKRIKKNIWIPESYEDYLNLDPVLVITNDDMAKEWNMIRNFTSTMKKDRKSTRLNSSHIPLSRMPSSA